MHGTVFKDKDKIVFMSEGFTTDSYLDIITIQTSAMEWKCIPCNSVIIIDEPQSKTKYTKVYQLFNKVTKQPEMQVVFYIANITTIPSRIKQGTKYHRLILRIILFIITVATLVGDTYNPFLYFRF